MANSMYHLNGNILCAVDVETTGFIPGFHDMWQIAVLPLDGEIQPSKNTMPFYMNMQVKRPENISKKAIKIANIDFYTAQKRAVDPWTAADMFDEWFQALKLPIYKKICPLASNWPFDRAFIIDWLGNETFQQLFHPHYRDTMVAALYDNDIANHRADKVEYHHVSLSALAHKMDVVNAKAHDALQDCITTAEVYRRLIMSRI